MARALPALPSAHYLRGWWLYPLVGVLAVFNLWMISRAAEWAVFWRLDSNDWQQIAGLPVNPYPDTAFRWTPLAADLWRGVVEPLGFGLWTLLHLTVLLILPRRVAFVMFLAGPFWMDVASGNVLTFAVAAAWFALRGNRAAIVGFVVLAVLVPRPLMLPVLAVCLWRHPWARWVFLSAAGVMLAHAIGTGLLDDFLHTLLTGSGAELTASYTYGPSRLIGIAWAPIGLALAAILSRRGWYGAASLCATPYLTHYYILFAILDVDRWRAWLRKPRLTPTGWR